MLQKIFIANINLLHTNSEQPSQRMERVMLILSSIGISIGMVGFSQLQGRHPVINKTYKFKLLLCSEDNFCNLRKKCLEKEQN